MEISLTKEQQRVNMEIKMKRFQELLKKAVQETGLSLEPALTIDKHGIRPVFEFVKVVSPEAKKVAEDILSNNNKNNEEN